MENQEKIIEDTMRDWNKRLMKAERACKKEEKFNPDFWMFREFAHYAAKVAGQREVIDWITCGFYANKKGVKS